MHRATPFNSSFRAFTSGGARSVVTEVNDLLGMQEMAGHFMANEARKAIESPQNFGFTSVVMDAIKDKIGAIIGSAETFISFMGGSRSFPIAGNMDDRRHRLTGLEKGDNAMYTTKGRKQQIHMSADGTFMSAPQNKTMRMALIGEDSEEDMTSATFQAAVAKAEAPGGGGAREIARLILAARGITLDPGVDPLPPGINPLADGGSSGAAGAGGAGGAGGGQQQGQQSLKDKNTKAKLYVDITKDKTTMAGKEAHMKLDDGNTYVHVKTNKVYAGAESSKGKFALVVTLKGPTKNVYGKIG
jgi:phage gp45-like